MNAPALALANVQSQPRALQRRAAECLKHDLSELGSVFHIADHNGDRNAKVSPQESYRTLGKLIAAALRDRVGNGKAVTIKQLSFALHISEQTVWNLLAGNSDPSGRVLMGLLSFFDAGFANQILQPTGCTVAKVCDKRAEALKKISEGMEVLRRLG